LRDHQIEMQGRRKAIVNKPAPDISETTSNIVYVNEAHSNVPSALALPEAAVV